MILIALGVTKPIQLSLHPHSPGKILTDDFADKEGLEMGDEYFANLDHIESVENFKEGYESEAHCSDSDGSGVDMSKIKIPPSALVSGSAMRRPTKKGDATKKTTGEWFVGPVVQSIIHLDATFL